jgi:hypothetical protein
MASDNGTSGTLFEGLLNEDPQVEKLAEIFANKNISIVSPTVSGFLSSFNSKADFANFKIAGCEDYESSLADFEKLEGDLRSKLSSNSEKTSESDYDSLMIDSLTESLTSFVTKVREIRSSYLPIKSELGGQARTTKMEKDAEGKEKEVTTGFSFGIDLSEMESHENAFMRMLGMPTEADIGGESSTKIFYFSPEKMNDGKLLKKTTTLAILRGKQIESKEDSYADILQERQRLPDAKQGGRKFNFSEVCYTTTSYNNEIDLIAKKIVSATNEGGSANGLYEAEKVLGYHIPDHLFRFYYLKSVPLQDSYIYGCISEPEKIVSKPFDIGSSQRINGIKQKTSLLETIIRLRLDRITGSPGIYSIPESNSSSPQLNAPGNTDTDKITQVECFLIQKLKKILYLSAEKYIKEILQKEEADIRAKVQLYNSQMKETAPEVPALPGAGAPAATQKAISISTEEQSKFQAEIKRLEILKAKEDAILFLLKDTSSSNNSGNPDSSYSSLDIQEGIIRTSSGFNDVLSAPLYSILSYRSQYLDKMIKELTELYDSISLSSLNKKDENKNPDDSGLIRNPGKDTFNYIGICKEDFLVYVIALLSLNQDYLIGLLSMENRKNLANTLSISILGKKKDPYGILDKIAKSPSNGGYPSVADSVNALGILVAQLYEEYISYIKNQNKTELEKLAKAISDSLK